MDKHGALEKNGVHVTWQGMETTWWRCIGIALMWCVCVCRCSQVPVCSSCLVCNTWATELLPW
jgi:hypothetical protein